MFNEVNTNNILVALQLCGNGLAMSLEALFANCPTFVAFVEPEICTAGN